MADELTTKRIINLPAESAPAAGDVFVVDNETTGTKKLPVTSLIDPTPTEGSAKAVRSGGVWSNAFIAERQILQSGDDADNLTLAGSYAKPASATVDNLPAQNSGYLMVITRGNVIYQLYITGAPSGGNLYFRKVGNDWKTLATAADIEGLSTSVESNYYKAFRSTLADGSDANDVITVGAYAKSSTRTINNIPSQSAGYLVVLTNGSDARQLYITHKAIFHRTAGRDWQMLRKSRLFGKKLIGIGDSLMYGQGMTSAERETKTYMALLNSEYGMTTYNYGVSGSPIADYTKSSASDPDSMATRIDSIAVTHADEEIDYFIIEGGANDYTTNAPLGQLTRDNTDKGSYYGALNYIITKVKATWPKARILLLTNYDRKLRGTSERNDETYVNAMLNFAFFRGIPVFDNYHCLGVSIQDYANPDYDPSTDPPEEKYLDSWFFSKAYGQHISIEGNAWVAPVYATKLESI